VTQSSSWSVQEKSFSESVSQLARQRPGLRKNRDNRDFAYKKLGQKNRALIPKEIHVSGVSSEFRDCVREIEEYLCKPNP
jgi:hypothetical protein